MTRSIMTFCAVTGAFWAIAAPAAADILWGTSYLTPAYYSGGQVWTVDTATGKVNILKNYDPTVDKISGYGIRGFGDIALAKGYIYTTVMTAGTQRFDLLAKIDPTNGAILNSWDICGTYTYSHGVDGQKITGTINSLTGVGGSLYGIEGGGVNNASTVRIDLDANGDFVSRTDYGNAGDMADGDLAIDPATGTWYGTFWSATGSTLDTIDPTTGNGTTGPNTGILSAGGSLAGLEFDSSGKLWAGSYADRNLYSINSLGGGGNTLEWDLSSQLGGNITGLAIPAPGALLLGVIGLGLVGWLKRRFG